MELVETVEELNNSLRKHRNSIIGLVPTMGYLHEGHLSLVKKAKKECDFIVMSIFVNPLQFGPNEDLDRYPRDLERDFDLARQAGVNVLYHPNVKEMYPSEPLITTKVSNKISNVLCGKYRESHFDGVTTVVAKLFNQTKPDRAYFGQKDAQQLAIITQMVKDLSFQVTVVPCETVREEDGLALSSRNVYLSEEEREQAPILSQILNEVRDGLIPRKWNTPDEINQYVRERISTKPLAKLQYIETLEYPNLQATTSLYDKQIIVALAAYFGKTRLIDNILFSAEGESHVPNDDEIQIASSHRNRS
ncbi:pantoate--beta-alanine ligase [Shimazuella sp. AN120528]|uniref:pantoate--beta-alanine ligase n=1 Tax=Shimazuella soli TaxID=1892854 RepID=UPI001F0D85CD|nr:pantoate--beta-alanine ligase [Shimazuella soli]MCH5585475.1 pantoate--beta-alanine ligase [Shimazuella soli]